jgi:hypothetical protein
MSEATTTQATATTTTQTTAATGGATATADAGSAKTASTGSAAGGETVLTGSATAPADAKPKTESGAADAKAGQGEAPAEISLKLPEGWQSGKEVDDFKAWAKSAKLTSEQAQAAFDLHVRTQQAQLQELQDHHAQQQREWTEALKVDKDFGGAKYDANRAQAQKAFTQFGSPELAQFLNETGLGNNPALVRWAWRVGQALGEDTPAGTGAGVRTEKGATDPQAPMKSMYPNSPELFGEPRREKPSATTK